ncbi:MAG: competence protein TfoX [Clostridia bacterium]|nr:competence protein TfoX [Clostridia bacterium]
MATNKDFLDYIAEQFNGEGLTFRPMMGEYLVYYRGKLVGDVCDNRLLIKPVESAKKLMPDAEYQLPYEGAKPMILVDNIDDGEFLRELFEKMYAELPEPKPKKKVQK